MPLTSERYVAVHAVSAMTSQAVPGEATPGERPITAIVENHCCSIDIVPPKTIEPARHVTGWVAEVSIIHAAAPSNADFDIHAVGKIRGDGTLLTSGRV